MNFKWLFICGCGGCRKSKRHQGVVKATLEKSAECLLSVCVGGRLLVKQIQGQQDGRIVCRIRMEALDSEQPAHAKSSESGAMHPVLSCRGVRSETLDWSSAAAAAAACKPSEGQRCSTGRTYQEKSEDSTRPEVILQFGGSFMPFYA